jgi:drug/metabolite transporter (DMT)-like permease
MSSTLTKSLTGKFQPMNLNLLRCLAASIFFWMIIPFYPGTKALTQTPSTPLLYLILSAVIGIAVGDTMYFRGLRLINVTLAFPIAQSAMPLMTLGAAVLFLGEPITWSFALGTVLVLGGIYLIITPQGKTRLLLRGRSLEKKGASISLILLAASLWAISISFLKVGLQQVNLILANGIRLPIASLLMMILVLMQNPNRQLARPRFRHISLGAFGGLLAFGIGGILFLWAIQTAGVGKAAVLTSSAPLFGLPLSVVYLKEEVTRKIILGTVLVVSGIIFLV